MIFRTATTRAAIRWAVFFLQDEHGDDDPLTSDGVFVFDNNGGTDVSVGDRVVVQGRVVEFFGETQIAARRVDVVGRGHIRPQEIPVPSKGTLSNTDGVRVADWEVYEGMLVRVVEPMTVVDLFNLERFGAVTLAAGGRLEQFTNAALPDVEAYRRHRDSVARHTLILDDGARNEYPMPPRFLTRSDGTALRLGDEVRSLTGNLRYARGSGAAGLEAFRLMPTVTPSILPARHRPASAPSVGGSLRVMSFNALNFFTTPDDGSRRCGPAARAGCRGADSSLELARQQEKLVAAIHQADAHIVGLMEIENNATSSLRLLVEALNARSSADWRYVDTGTIGSDAIRVGLIYAASAATRAGDFAILTREVDARFDDARNRPALAQSFVSRATGGRLTVAVTHLKSKGSPCDDAGDPDLGDGQGNCNLTRSRAARALADWLATDPTGVNDSDALIIGDLNAYLREDPLQALAAAGFANLVSAAPGSITYSFAYRGELGALDHALASPSLRDQVTRAAVWHINADEAPLLDYNLENNRDPQLFDARSPFRASDHDPIIVGLELTPE